MTCVQAAIGHRSCNCATRAGSQQQVASNCGQHRRLPNTALPCSPLRTSPPRCSKKALEGLLSGHSQKSLPRAISGWSCNTSCRIRQLLRSLHTSVHCAASTSKTLLMFLMHSKLRSSCSLGSLTTSSPCIATTLQSFHRPNFRQRQQVVL